MERREAILACAEGMFSERGFDATPMEGIAACADISPATLYNFFPTKLDILTEIFGREVAARMAAARGSPLPRPAEVTDAVMDLVTLLFESFAAFDRGLLRRVTLNALNEGPDRDAGARYVLAESEMAAEIEALLRARQLAGELPPDAPLADVARAIFACGNGEYYVWLGDDDARLDDTLKRVRRHVDLILRPLTGAVA